MQNLTTPAVAPNSLQIRFIRALLVAAGVFALVAASLSYLFSYERAIRQGEESLQSLLTAVERTAVIGAYASDKVLLKEVADGLVMNHLVDEVRVLDAAGQVLLVATHPQVSPAPRPSTDTSVRAVRTLMSPFESSEQVGSLEIRANMAKLKENARTEAVISALLMLTQAVAVAAVVYLVAAKVVSNPILNMATSLRAMQPGTAQRVPLPPEHQSDEIGSLIVSANQLLQANEDALLRERQLREEVASMEALYRAIFDASSAGIFVLGLDRRLINSNPTALQVAGLAEHPMDELRQVDFIAATFATPEAVHEMIERASATGQTLTADLELRQPHRLARWVHCLISVQRGTRSPAGAPGTQGTQPTERIEGVMYDITDRRQAERAALHLASHDLLTGLKNRSGADAAIDRMLTEARASQTAVALLYMDLDGFKQVNDLHGHKAGDAVLAECARRMKTQVRRASDLCARIGGDEFVVALHHTGPDSPILCRIAQGLLAQFQDPFELDDGSRLHVGLSIGVACFPLHGQQRKQLLHMADMALYEVKRTGKHCVAMSYAADLVIQAAAMPGPAPTPSGPPV
ncbi:MAG TPA: sensor domain-containing diguanylate cyclase [Burkholderiaceae bacterium]|nr:sensor domain-containing diguanylate cyclase [Burkholderiaceae bacterium]